MTNIKDVTTAIYNRLVATASLISLSCVFARSTRVNFDPAIAPWIGVYPGPVETSAKAMGGRSWNDQMEVQIVVQNASLATDGTAASDLLENLIDAVMEELAGTGKDLSLGISGLRIMSFSREYRYVVFDSDGNGDLFMPQAIIKVKIEVRT